MVLKNLFASTLEPSAECSLGGGKRSDLSANFHDAACFRLLEHKNKNNIKEKILTLDGRGCQPPR